MENDKQENENTNIETPNIDTSLDSISKDKDALDDPSLTKEEIEEELPVPDDDAKLIHINTSSIFLVIIGIVLLLILLVTLFSNRNKKNERDNELDKTGLKSTYINFDEKKKTKTQQENIVKNTTSQFTQEKEKETKTTDETIANLHKDLQLPQQGPSAPAPVGSAQSYNYNGSYNSYNSRPDTRNSKSPRTNIDGIKREPNQYANAQAQYNQYIAQQYGQNQGTPTMQNSSNLLGNRRPTQEEYIQQMLSGLPITNTQQGYNNNAGIMGMYQNRNDFFNQGQPNANNNIGNGQFLSNNTLWDGTVISGALQTRINTDNPGIVIARVTENVWSSYDHSFLLIPEGTLLYATYNSSVSYGQNRVQIAWNLLIRPDGYRLELGNMNGVDAQGASGVKGSVNEHPFQIAKAFGLIGMYSLLETEATKEGTQIKFITNVPLTLPPVEVYRPEQPYIRTR